MLSDDEVLNVSMDLNFTRDMSLAGPDASEDLDAKSPDSRLLWNSLAKKPRIFIHAENKLRISLERLRSSACR